jgi:hypothetical protein
MCDSTLVVYKKPETRHGTCSASRTSEQKGGACSMNRFDGWGVCVLTTLIPHKSFERSKRDHHHIPIQYPLSRAEWKKENLDQSISDNKKTHCVGGLTDLLR